MARFRLFDENRVSIYVIGGSFFLSLILGMIRGNPGGIVMMRAFLSALLFGIIFQGGVYVLRKYIPDFTTDSMQTDEKMTVEEPERDTGTVIDYEVGAEEESLPVDLDLDEGPIQKFSEGETLPEGEGEEVREDEVFEKEEVEKPSEEAVLDELPSIEHLFDEEEEAHQESEGQGERERAGRSVHSDYIQIGETHFPNEPKALAKAVKKVMNEDVKR